MSKQNVQAGERFCGCVFGNNPERPENGVFAQYIAVPSDLIFKLPHGVSFETGATLGMALSTVGMALYHTWGLPLPEDKNNGIPDGSQYVWCMEERLQLRPNPHHHLLALKFPPGQIAGRRGRI